MIDDQLKSVDHCHGKYEPSLDMLISSCMKSSPTLFNWKALGCHFVFTSPWGQDVSCFTFCWLISHLKAVKSFHSSFWCLCLHAYKSQWLFHWRHCYRVLPHDHAPDKPNALLPWSGRPGGPCSNSFGSRLWSLAHGHIMIALLQHPNGWAAACPA